MVIHTEMNLSIIAEPSWRELVCRVHVCEGDWEVNEEKVEVVQSPELELKLRGLFDLISYKSLR